jgi:hypothetical protein
LSDFSSSILSGEYEINIKEPEERINIINNKLKEIKIIKISDKLTKNEHEKGGEGWETAIACIW